MTTAAIFEIHTKNEKAYIYGTHDSYPDEWPVLAVKYVMENRGKPLNDLVKGVLKVLRDWDYDVHKQTADLYNYGGWKETEKEIRRLISIHFRQISESDIPKNIEKGWDFWYIVDLGGGTIRVRRIVPKECFDYDYEADIGGWYVCGEKEVIEFEGSLEDYVKKYEKGS